MKNRYGLFSRAGFTLTGLIVSLGVMSIIGLTLATFSVNSFGFMGGMSQIARLNEIVEEAKVTLTGENQCTQNLANKEMADTENK